MKTQKKALKQSHFVVDRRGLAQTMARRSKSFVVTELVQNAFDQNVTEVLIDLQPVPGRPLVRLVVTDDDPAGWADLTASFTLFGESTKKRDASKRGRFCLGEKLAVAVCECAEIATTTGTVVFDRDGREHHPRRKRAAGSQFTGVLAMTREELAEAERIVRSLVVPDGVRTVFNGVELPARTPVAEFTATLPTEIADDDGSLRPTKRATRVRLYEPHAGEIPTLYELGIPVVEIGDRWHIDVQQKIPVSFERDNVRPSYLRRLRTLVVNEMVDALTPGDATLSWVTDALGHDAIGHYAVERVLDLRFGAQRVIADPSDPEAQKLAVSAGYTVIPGGALTKAQWSNVKRHDAAKPAGQVTPSFKPYHPDGEPLNAIDPSTWTRAMAGFADYASSVIARLLERPVTVTLVREPGWGAVATFGPSCNLTVNLARVREADYSRVPCEAVDDLLIHEAAHGPDGCGDHLDERYYRELTRLGAKLAAIWREDSSFFERWMKTAVPERTDVARAA